MGARSQRGGPGVNPKEITIPLSLADQKSFNHLFQVLIILRIKKLMQTGFSI